MRDAVFVLGWFAFWSIFWPFYGICFWGIYGAIFDSLYWALRGMTLGIFIWSFGGCIGAIVGIIYGLLVLFFDMEDLKIALTLKAIAWAVFWVILWRMFFWPFVAGMLMTRNPIIIGSVGLNTRSEVPMILFAATGGIVGGMILEILERKYSAQ